MKSKASRMGGKLNEVHQNIVICENIKKENYYLQNNIMENYQLNPNNVNILQEKPNKVDPRTLIKGAQEKLIKDKQDHTKKQPFTDDPVEEAFSNEKLAKNLKSVTLVPRQKYNFPQTSNQDIGWFNNQLNVQKPTKNHALNKCEITEFVDSYYSMTHVNPFKHNRSGKVNKQQ